MVSISTKEVSKRTATAVCNVHFSNHVAATLIRENRAKKGDVLGVARIAGIMAAKRTADLIPLCHPISITHVGLEVELSGATVVNAEGNGQANATRSSIPWAGTGQGDAYGWSSSSLTGAIVNSTSQPAEEEELQHPRVDITATVSCEGKTGVEMEALTAASVAALTVYDMCKAVDKGMRIEGLRVVRKEGGKSGIWVEGVSVS
jgi:molybdenum cofactor biosynthesis enzyme